MKRKLEENGEGEGPPKHMYGPMQHYGGWQPRGQGNMRGGGGGGFRGGRGGPWRGPRMPNNHGPRGFFRGNRGRGGPSRFPYDNSQQYKQQWHQQQFPHEHHHQHPENNSEIDTTQGGASCSSGGNCVQGTGNMGCNWTERREVNNQSGNNSSGTFFNDTNNQTANSHGVVIVEESYTKTKVKRRPMSQNYSSRPWNKEDAAKALAVETAHMKGMKNESLIIRFPDPELTKDMVKNFHPGIENVHFQVPSSPRFCFVQLAANVNPDAAIKDLSKIKFGNGKLLVEKKFSKEEEDLKPEAIDPYTLYIGNLPTNVNVATVKEKFPTASRVDVGFAQRMKFTRYAFIRYTSVDDAIDAFKLNHDLLLESRSLIVRFRRVRGPIGLPGESRQQKPPKAQKKEAVKPKKEKEKNDTSSSKGETKDKEKDDNDDDDDEDEDEDDDDDDDDEDDTDDDDDDSDDDDDEDDDDDDDDDDEDEVGPDAADDDPDVMDDEDDDEEDDDDDEEEEEDDDGLSRRLFQQIDAQIQDLDESFHRVTSADEVKRGFQHK